MRWLGASTPGTRRGSGKGGVASLGVLHQFFFVPSVLALFRNDRAGEVEQEVAGAIIGAAIQQEVAQWLVASGK